MATGSRYIWLHVFDPTAASSNRDSQRKNKNKSARSNRGEKRKMTRDNTKRNPKSRRRGRDRPDGGSLAEASPELPSYSLYLRRTKHAIQKKRMPKPSASF